ncbi:hypothetical protein FOZ60_015531 [Perkinsus olseni]|uniref:Mitogen-activated protein kinase n=1 Tax=Perkinsus olseni TaxID=32597 RepID=A0A7J6P5D4_PEROL|nr:hypothetical protein FOZ60_015531 [Perkinsus olseni]
MTTYLEEMKQVHIDGKTSYTVPRHMEFIRKVGSGAYGTVASFSDGRDHKVAVKKVQNAFDDLIDAKRILREIKLLRTFDHDNIVRILDMYPPQSPDFEDIYIVTDLMETDLHRVIYSKQNLTDEHYQYFIYQMLRGMKYLHSANVIHRDLKPSNILVNKNCDLKICDFGLARGFSHECDESQLAAYYANCSAVGHSLRGKDHLDQIKKIIEVSGMPSEDELHWLPPDGPARRFIRKCPQSRGKAMTELYPQANPLALDLVKLMLRFDPTRRISVDQALKHPYLEGYHSPDDEPEAERPVDWSFDNFKPTKRLLQNYVYCECARFHPGLLQRDAGLFAPRGLDVALREYGLL